MCHVIETLRYHIQISNLSVCIIHCAVTIVLLYTIYYILYLKYTSVHHYILLYPPPHPKLEKKSCISI